MIPHNNELQTKFAQRGLVIVGVTNEPEKLVEKYVADNKVAYPIVIEKSYHSATELKVAGYPSAVLVDPKGVVVWSGHPGSLNDATIEAALKGARPPGLKLPAALKPLEPILAKRDFGKAYETVKGMLGGTLDDEAKKAAEELVANLESDAKALADSADANTAAKKFFEAQDDLEALMKNYARIPASQGADAKLKALQADPEAKKSIRASEQLAKARDLENDKDFDKAWAAYKSITTTAAGTVPAEAAAAKMAEIEKKGMLGFEKKCYQCNELGKPCPKHKKKPK